ncbi:hypothetical protein Syun_018634 [Stephania yunnanensis]|uniref:Transposase-associated domain-containing protein n=1 Tax=Stephania yunnanensis TaxID=152371 RepID=A0AAP0ISL2_9MAGN
MAGVKKFIKFAMQHCTSFLNEVKTRCTCQKCRNEKYYNVNKVELLLASQRFVLEYHYWMEHGEEELINNVDDPVDDDLMDEYPTSYHNMIHDHEGSSLNWNREE